MLMVFSCKIVFDVSPLTPHIKDVTMQWLTHAKL